MYSLTISFGSGASSTMWTLMWRDEKIAREAFIEAYAPHDTLLHLKDEFGQVAVIKRENITGIMLEDMNLSKLAHIERALHQARVQAEGQTMAESDHVLRAARARQGSAILTPGIPGNGMMR